MVLDSSAIIAILSLEPEAQSLANAIEADSVRLISAANLLETAIVIETRYGSTGGQKLDEFLQLAEVKIEAVTAAQTAVARIAYRTYGKGRHPASLNFGDCFSYALSQVSGEPLLCKGDDFRQTDLELVSWSV